MKIEITQHHIDTGTVRSAFRCAIAEALKQEFAYEIKITSNSILIGKDYYEPTSEVARWIADFDKGEKVEPITIELASDPSMQKTYRQKNNQPIYLVGEARIVDS